MASKTRWRTLRIRNQVISYISLHTFQRDFLLLHNGTEKKQKNQCCKSRKLVVKHSFIFALERDGSVGVKMVVGVAWAGESHFEQLRFPLPTQITRKRIAKRG